jgi:hypothetical protein
MGNTWVQRKTRDFTLQRPMSENPFLLFFFFFFFFFASCSKSPSQKSATPHSQHQSLPWQLSLSRPCVWEWVKKKWGREKCEQGRGGAAWNGEKKRKKSKKKRKRNEGERVSGTLVPLWVVGRRWCYLLLTNPMVTCSKVRLHFYLNA